MDGKFPFFSPKIFIFFPIQYPDQRSLNSSSKKLNKIVFELIMHMEMSLMQHPLLLKCLTTGKQIPSGHMKVLNETISQYPLAFSDCTDDCFSCK